MKKIYLLPVLTVVLFCLLLNSCAVKTAAIAHTKQLVESSGEQNWAIVGDTRRNEVLNNLGTLPNLTNVTSTAEKLSKAQQWLGGSTGFIGTVAAVLVGRITDQNAQQDIGAAAAILSAGVGFTEFGLGFSKTPANFVAESMRVIHQWDTSQKDKKAYVRLITRRNALVHKYQHKTYVQSFTAL